MDTEKLRELEQEMRQGIDWAGGMNIERTHSQWADRLRDIIAAQPPKAEAEVEVFVDSLGCQRSRVRWADGELDPPPSLAHGTKLYTATPTAAADWTDDAEKYGNALNEAAWVFIEECPEKSALLFNNTKEPLRAAILKYAEVLAAARNQEACRG